MDHVDPFDWKYAFRQEPRSDMTIFRPVVPVRFPGAGPLATEYEALVDSGSMGILTPTWVGNMMGIGFDREPDQIVRIGGGKRKTWSADVDMELLAPIDGVEPIRWRPTVGFMDWSDPPLMVILGQRGFFDCFSVCMSFLAKELVVHHRDQFDGQYGHLACG